MKKAALAFTALLLLPLLPVGGAANPETEPWAPYDALSPVRALAIATEGTTIAAALAPAVDQPQTPSPAPTVPTVGAPGTTTPAQRGDLAILDAKTGFQRNGTRSATTPAAGGKTHVAVSRGGDTIAALGPETASSSPTHPNPLPILKLHYTRAGNGANWSASPSLDIKLELENNASALRLSEDGRRVLVITQDADRFVMRGWTLAASNLVTSFEFRGEGTAHDVAATGDFSRIVLASQGPAGHQVRTFAFAPTPPTSTYDSTGEIRAVGISREGGVVGAASPTGELLVFPRGAGDLSAPVNVSVGTTPITKIAISEDGSRITALSGRTLAHFGWTGSTIQPHWNATLPGTGNVTLSINRTGELVLAAVQGNGMYAYADKDGVPGWSFTNAAMTTALVNGPGTEVVYALGSRIVASKLSREIALEFAGGQKTGPAKPVMAGVGATFELAVRNPGAAPETVEITAPGLTDLTFTSTPSRVVVKPNEIVSVNVTVASEAPFTAQRSVSVVARSLGSGLQDNVTLLLLPETRTNVSLQLNASEVIVRAGIPSPIVVGVLNNGTVDTAVTLRVTQQVSSGRAWDVKVGDSDSGTTTFTALRGARASVRITVTPPAEATNGTSSTLTLALSGENVTDAGRVVFRINPNLGVGVNATGVTRFIEPGKRAVYNITVTNNGSLPRQYEAYYEIVSPDAKPWAVDVPSGPFRLDPNAKRTIPIGIVAPAAAIPGTDRVSVVVFARSIPEGVNETAVVGNVTLYGIAVAPPPTPTPTDAQNAIPFLPAAIALALAAFVALARRRRA